MRRAFVSHSSADDSYVAEMESFLRAAGFDEVFNDVSAIRPDEQFWPEIGKGIANCDAFVVVITTASNASEWVKREVEYARGLSKKIIPVWIEDCAVPPIFADRDVIDFRPRTREERRIDISRIFKYAPAELIGREDETKLLNDAWQKVLRLEQGRPHVLTFVALGGEGKTSLVAKWAVELAHQDWPGCDAVFAWSFYSQGTREQTAVSSDLFLAEALAFFGDAAMAGSAAGAFDKGRRLAQLVGERRALLILDGVEPLQYAPTSPTPGELKDQGLAALLKGLAATSHGLCVVTTRYALPDLRAFLAKTVREEKLTRLSTEAGVALLRTLGVKGTPPEFEKLVEDVQGHALTLNLLGSFLRDAHNGDIRQRDLVKLEEADAEEQGGHAFRVMDAYVRWLESSPGLQPVAPSSGLKPRTTFTPGQRCLALLSLLGLFDRPATADCLKALWKGEAIAGLTEPLIGLSEAQRNLSLTRLEDAKLLTVNRAAGSGELVALDAHPLLREYFARRVREQQPEAWRAAHRRLYEHLCASTQEGGQPTLEALQPLYQAVAHGCQAGLQQEACEKVYRDRISRGSEAYVVTKLGAFGSDLGAVTCFFAQPWSQISLALVEPAQAWLLGQAAFRLRALGRLNEALEPMRATVALMAKQENWEEAAKAASNLSELELTLGELAAAVGDAEQSVTYADRSGDAFMREVTRTAHADALHQAGRRAEAEARFREAEQMQAERQPAYPLLYSLRGFQYCDLLLTEAERAAWQATLECGGKRQRGAALGSAEEDAVSKALSPRRSASALQGCRAVSERAAQTLKWVTDAKMSLLTIALDHLTLGRAALYAAILGNFDLRTSTLEIDHAASGLRRAGQIDELPKALLTRAWQRRLTGALTDSTSSPQAGPESAQSDLDEAWEIAERGPMPLFLADIHLHRARLFGRMKDEGGRMKKSEDGGVDYPWESPQHDLAEARRLIEKHGYGRRKEELEDAEAAILGRP
jgi:tetratricopeptide (TPR) repeat protein